MDEVYGHRPLRIQGNLILIHCQSALSANQWRAAQECRPGRRSEMPPILTKKFKISTAEISDELFSHLPKFYLFSPSFDVRAPFSKFAAHFTTYKNFNGLFLVVYREFD